MIAIGKLVKAVGLKGEIKLYPYSDQPSCFDGCEVIIAGNSYTLHQFRMQKKMGYMKLDGIDHIDQTEQLIDQEVFMKRDDIELDDDEYLITELIGLRVETDTGEDLGLVRDILSHSGNDILVVQGEQEVLIPMVDEFVKDISLQQHKIVVSLIEGM